MGLCLIQLISHDARRPEWSRASPVDIRTLVSKWSEHLAAPRPVRRIYGALRPLNHAGEVDRLARTLCRGIHLPTVEPTAVTISDSIQLNTLDSNYSVMGWLGAVLGLGWDKVAGLRFGHVDLLRKTVTVAEPDHPRHRRRRGHRAIQVSRRSTGHFSIPTELADELSPTRRCSE